MSVPLDVMTFPSNNVWVICFKEITFPEQAEMKEATNTIGHQSRKP